MALGDRIKERRIALKLNQSALAKLSGVKQTQISKYELGLAEPVASNLMALATVLDVSMEWLVGMTDEPPNAPRLAKELSDTEQQVVVLYRAKSEEKQRLIKELLEMF